MKAPAFVSRKEQARFQKTKRAGLELPREAARSFNSLEFALRFWEREAAPAELLPDAKTADVAFD